MAHLQLAVSPASTLFAMKLGANGMHLGILGALPTALLFAQLVSGAWAGRLSNLKTPWFVLSLAQRLVLVPIALGPWLFPHVSPQTWLWGLIATLVVHQGLQHFGTPLWLSWMADLLPKRGLSELWGRRHHGMHCAAAGALCVSAFIVAKSGMSVTAAFTSIMLAATVLGVIDILLFARVPEPRRSTANNPIGAKALAAPLRDRRFRRFIAFSSFWHASVMVGAPFIHPYLLKHVGMELFHALLLWGVSWFGGAYLSTWLGKLTERHGQRPIFILSTLFKSANMLALLLAPASPVVCFAILAPVFMFDVMLNAAMAIATNGFILRHAPDRLRPIYIGAGMAFAGTAGGVASVLAGLWLASVGPTVVVAGRPMLAFHVIFAASLVLRLLAVQFARRLEEPAADGAGFVARRLLTSLRGRFGYPAGRPV